MEYPSLPSRSRLRSLEFSDNVLNKSIYNPPSGMDLNRKFWWEAFGMFIFVNMIGNLKPFYGFDFWITAILPIGIMLSVKQSGAHYNPSMTLSNFLIKWSPQRYNPTFAWTYFKADFIPAFIAYNIAYYMRGFYYPPGIPINNWDSYKIIVSELVGTFMLTLLLQKVCNSQTTFTTSDIETYSFVVAFVYVARRYAILSGNSINPVTTLAAACSAIFQCEFGPFKYAYLYVIGDFLGCVAGSTFYNAIYEPALQASRRQRASDNERYRSQVYQEAYKRSRPGSIHQSLSKVIRDIQLQNSPNQSQQFGRNLQTIQHRNEEQLSNDLQFEMFELNKQQKQ